MANSILARRRRIPKFPRQDAIKKVKLGDSWRTPKGRYGRRKHLSTYKGYSPKIGYGTPNENKHKTSAGLLRVEVANPAALAKVDPKTHAIIINRVGLKNKIAIVKAALDKKIKILNLRKPEEFLEKNKK